VQKEVAQRICAEPGDMSLLAVSVQFYAQPQMIHTIPAGAFYPRPQVDSAVLRLDGVVASEYSGWSVSAAGDINGDGIDDLIIGAPDATFDGLNEAGISYVVFGRDVSSLSDFPPTLALASLNGMTGFRLDGAESSFSSTGQSVSAAGDFNGDGIDDLVIGAPGADPDGNSNAGSSYVMFGGIGGPGEIPQLAVLPLTLDFGNIDPGTMVVDTLSVENTGNITLELNLIVSGTNSSDFSVQSNNCDVVPLAAGQMCQIDIKFSPVESGLRSAVLQIGSAQLGTPKLISLHGSSDVIFFDGFE